MSGCYIYRKREGGSNGFHGGSLSERAVLTRNISIRDNDRTNK